MCPGGGIASRGVFDVIAGYYSVRSCNVGRVQWVDGFLWWLVRGKGEGRGSMLIQVHEIDRMEEEAESEERGKLVLDPNLRNEIRNVPKSEKVRF